MLILGDKELFYLFSLLLDVWQVFIYLKKKDSLHNILLLIGKDWYIGKDELENKIRSVLSIAEKYSLFELVITVVWLPINICVCY